MSSALPDTSQKVKRSAFADFVMRLVREKPLGTVCGVIVLLFIFTAIFADLLAPYAYDDNHPADALEGPSAEYILGTDNLGRDMLSRVIYGARISVVVGFTATALSLLISIVVGILTGFIGGKFDMVVQRFVDAWMCFPGIIFLIAMVSLIGPGIWQVVLVMGLVFGVAGSRIVRSAVIAIKENTYIYAAIAAGSNFPPGFGHGSLCHSLAITSHTTP